MSDFVVAPAPRPIAGEVRVPGDKSIGHRAVLFGSLTDGPCEVRGLSGGEDNHRTVAALAAMGVRIEPGPDALVVHGVGLRGLSAPAAPLDCGNSGTSMRLLAGLLAGQAFPATLVGDAYLHRRPMRRIVAPLSLMGARIEGEPGKKEGEQYPPLRVSPAPGPLQGITYDSPVASAQVKSAILIAGLYARGRTQVREPGPTRDHTERMLALLGAPVDGAQVDTAGWDGRLAARPLPVPGDPSSAAFLIAAAVLAGGGAGVTVRGVCVNPTRTGFLDALRAMGAVIEERGRRVEAGEPVADLHVAGPPPGGLRGVELGGDLIVRAIDEVPVLAMVAARARGVTTVRDAQELRVKESDRAAGTVRLLAAFGVAAEERPDGLVLSGIPDKLLRGGAVIDSEGDHRLAMAAAVAALVAAGPTRIEDVDNVATSFPSFAELLGGLGADIRVTAGT